MGNVSQISTTSSNLSVGNLISQYGYKWGSSDVGMSVNITYSIASATSFYLYSDTASVAKATMTVAQKAAVLSAMNAVSSFCGLTFKSVGDTGSNYGDIRWGSTQSPSVPTSYAYLPTNTSAQAGDIWIGSQYAVLKNPQKGDYGYHTFIHELGHALGLNHPHEGVVTAPNGEDQMKYSVMSYRSYDGASVTTGYTNSFFPTSYMINDILTLQYLYGVNTKFNAGNNTYTWTSSQKIFETIWDGGGVDTIDASVQASAVKIYLTSGKWSEIGQAFSNGQTMVRDCLTIAYGAVIENATGSAFDDTLEGNSANNVLNGKAGNDVMSGLAGDDTYVVDSINDVVVELANEGIDKIQSAVTWSLGANIENLALTGNLAINGTGNSLDNTIIGNANKNILIGMDGNDYLDGGLSEDTLTGGSGNDTYVVDNTKDQVIEKSNEGTDTINSFITYVLPTNFENLTLMGISALNATGNEGDNIIIGNSGNNIIYGLIGNDTLEGGVGKDTLFGGVGNDIYIIDNTDIISEQANEGVDTVKSALSYTLKVNFENLTLLGTASINATGNSVDNTLIGNVANNVMDGGAGNDNLMGGVGNDTYLVDSISDIISEYINEGIDSVKSSVSYILSSNLENISLIGLLAINATGNELNNTLVGNSSVNTLKGMGGDDTYVVDSLADTLIENANEGIDTVLSSVSWTLSNNFENLSLNGITNLNATGNSADNILTGNSGMNILDGGDGNDTLDGKVGIDTLKGGLGDDIYYIDNAKDIIVENLSSGNDTVYTSVTYTLGTNVEKLSLLGASAIGGTGNESNNTLLGNIGNNILDGGAGNDILIADKGNDSLKGGTGSDTLTGGEGIDTFYFSSFGVTNFDVITDFVTKVDKIALQKSVFTGVKFTATDFYSALFTNDQVSSTQGQHLIFDQASKTLWYDADGAASVVAVPVVQLLGVSVNLVYSDIISVT